MPRKIMHLSARTRPCKRPDHRTDFMRRPWGSSTAPKCCTRFSIDMTRLLIRRAGHHASAPGKREKFYALALGGHCGRSVATEGVCLMPHDPAPTCGGKVK